MEQAYVLRLYDTDLLSFSLSEQGIEGLKAQIHSIDEEDRALFPLDLELTDDGLVKWLQRRVIPKNRAYVAEILKTPERQRHQGHHRRVQGPVPERQLLGGAPGFYRDICPVQSI